MEVDGEVDNDDGDGMPDRTSKRLRHTQNDSSVSNGDSTDCYGDDPAGGDLHQSWLTERHCIQRTATPHAATEAAAETAARPVDPFLEHQISSLNQQLLQVKRRLWPAAERCSRWPSREFQQARSDCNPYEVLGRQRDLFINRSAVKLANMDAMLSIVRGPAQFCFADLCGAPGGFSEYILQRFRTAAGADPALACRGYGMSLMGRNEHGQGTPWQLPDHIDDGRIQYRICHGVDGTGDLYKWENVVRMRQDIQQDLQRQNHIPTDSLPHLVVSDGGFDAQRDSECQEQLAAKLVVCEAAAGLFLLCPGGSMVIKMFGFQTDTVRTMMADLHGRFEQIHVVKPITSRPASSERYVVFSGFLGLPTDWDGPRWINCMFLGSAGASIRHGGPVLSHPPILPFLDEVDRQMLTLNLKACFDILSYLDRKAAAVESGLLFHHESARIDVEWYKKAWRLE